MLTFVRVLAVLVVVFAACQQPDPQPSSTAQETVVMPVSSHDFGSLQVGQTSAPFTFTINPARRQQLRSISLITESCPDFSVNAPGFRPASRSTGTARCARARRTPRSSARPCAARATCSRTVHDDVLADGRRTAVACTVTITLNGGATTKLVTLNGTGTPPPVDIDVHPTSVNFGDVRRDNDSTAVAITVANLGGSTMT